MSERVAIVTGAGGELGRATAAKLAAAGYGASSTGLPPRPARPRCW
jgi:NAD(P)-dependent dehydrogenase (short-subunit alcohol dehydrogenase family)